MYVTLVQSFARVVFGHVVRSHAFYTVHKRNFHVVTSHILVSLCTSDAVPLELSLFDICRETAV